MLIKAKSLILGHLSISENAVIYLGDDVTNEDVFNELGDSGITVHVGSADAPSCARMNAENPADVADFLKFSPHLL